MKILLIDNYDSFVYNLYQYLGELGTDVVVFRNDALTLEDIEKIRPDRIVISPGPKRPETAGISVEVVKKFSAMIPILGVCLGHQAIAYAFGGKIIQARRIVHGKTSQIYHDGKGVFRDIPYPFVATRYHSLAVDENTLPECLIITARSEDGEIMGIRHKTYPTEGVQFHPESILTKEGKKLLKNFITLLS